MATNQENVMIVVEQLIKGGQRMESFNQTMNQMSGNLQRNNQKLMSHNEVLKTNQATLRKVTASYSTFGAVMRMNNQLFAGFVRNGVRFDTFWSRTAARIRMATAGLHGFRMEMLGVMFLV